MKPEMVLLLIVCSAMGAWTTHRLAPVKGIGTVRASAIATLIFVIFSNGMGSLLLIQEQLALLQACFFGASFIGMSDPEKLGEKQVLGASAVFSVLFIFALPYLKHLGGALGATALVSSLFVYGVSRKPYAWGEPNQRKSP